MDLNELIRRELWSMNEENPLNEEVLQLYHGSPYDFDKFDLSKVGSGDGLNKFGFGLYFADREDTAHYYAKELSIGDNRKTGFNIYQIRINGDFLNWDEEIPHHVHNCVVEKLRDMNYDSDADTMEMEAEEYGTFWSMNSLYDILSHVVGSQKNASQFLIGCGVDGVIAQSPAHEGNVVVSFRDDNIRILNKERITESRFIKENVQQFDKELLNTNKLTPEDKENILSITHGDNFTFILGMFYHWIFSPDAPAYNTQEKRNQEFNKSHYHGIYKDFYDSVKNYNKNVFPIKNYDITLKHIHPIDMFAAIQSRQRILKFLKRIPSLYTRNLTDDIRTPRDEAELKYGVEEEIKRISSGLKMVDNLSDDKKEIVFKKIFSSNNKTFKNVADQLEKTEILFLNHDDAEEEVRSKVDGLDNEAEVLYDQNNIMVVDIKSSDAMKVLGCGSQWCFAGEHGTGHWENYADNRNVNIVYNFNEEPDSKTRMVVLLPTGEVYNMYNEHMGIDDNEIDGWEYLQSIGVEDVTNANVVSDGYLKEYEHVGTQFDVQKFDTLNSYAARKRYADQTLEKLGAGSARIVYKIDNNTALKLAKNPKGLEQNREECGLGQDNYFNEIVAKVEDCHTDDLWIISELAKKTTPTRFRQIVGVDIRNLEMYIRNFASENKGGRSIYGIDPKIKEQLSENMFVQTVLELMQSYDLLAGDLGRLSSYGEVVRDGEPTIILIDYGITNDTYNTMYAKTRESVHENYFDDTSEVNPKEIFDGGYGGIANSVQSEKISETISDEIINKKKMNKPIGAIFSIGGLTESIDKYRNVGDNVVKNVAKYIENLTNIVKPRDGRELSKLLRSYLIGSQNIERALELADNEIGFYDNLIKIQNILKRFGLLNEDLVYSHVSDASPESDSYQIVSEAVSGFNKSTADEISMKAAEKLGMSLPHFIGDGGFGYAYQSGDKVIKITKDQSEAVESLKLKGKQTERIAEIYGVYSTEYKTYGENSIYIIVLEKLNTGNAQNLYFELSKLLEKDFEESIDDVVESYLYYPEKWDIKYEHIEYYLSEYPKQLDFLSQLIEIADEANKLGIESRDYMNKYNLGYKKDGKLGFFDVGFGQYDFGDEKPELLHVKEDGTSLYTDVQGTVNERITSFMPNSDTVEVKKNCKLAGKGDGTSDACNQGDIKNLDIKPLKENRDNWKPEYGALMLFFDIPKWDSILSKIKDEDLADPEKGFGKETDPHITVLYGFHDNEIKPDVFDPILSKVDKPIELLAKGISLFENEKFDVVKIDIEPTEELLTLRKEVENLPKTLTYKDYHPHMTIAYVKSGKGHKYVKEFSQQIKLKADHFVYSDKDKKHTKFDINSSKKTILKENYDAEYKKWKRENVTYRGVSDDAVDGENGGMAMLGQGLYSVPASNKAMAKGYGKLAILVNAKPKNPKIFNTLNDWEIWFQQNIVFPISKSKGKDYPDARDVNSISDEMMKRGYDGIIIKGREIVNYKPEDVRWYYNERQLEMYYDDFVVSNKIDESTSINENVGYKVMKFENGMAISGANSREKFPVRKGQIFTMGGNGIYLTPNQQYAIDYYSGLADNEVLLTFEYDPNEIITGDLNDKEPEISVRNAKLIDFKVLDDSERRNENMIIEENISTLQDLPFKEDVEGMGGKIYSVGGAVRDEFLGKDSKDLDILITGVPFDHLEELLSHYGKVDAVGKSFGVLKFKSKGSMEEIDIAIPRTEKATGDGGHKGFDVTSDHSLPIEKDLERRDFTINAIAKDSNGQIIDPFGGQKDLQNKIIRIVNPQAFSDDPLRMLRAVQFASRFAFTIEPKTMQMIIDNASRVKEIAPERILIELEKIVKKGDVLYGADLLRETGLYEQIFGAKSPAGSESHWDLGGWNNIKTLGEYIFMLAYPVVDDPAEFYKKTLKGDIPTYKEIKALSIGMKNASNDSIKNRMVAYNMYANSPESFNTRLVTLGIKKAIDELNSGKYPKSLKELAVNGNDLMQRGLSGKEIGDTLKSLLIKVYADKIKNNKEDLLNNLSVDVA